MSTTSDTQSTNSQTPDTQTPNTQTSGIQQFSATSDDDGVPITTPPSSYSQLWDQYVKDNETFKENMKRCLQETFEKQSNIDDLNDIPTIMCKYPLPQFITDYYTFPKHINSIYNRFASLEKIQFARVALSLAILIVLGVIAYKI